MPNSLASNQEYLEALLAEMKAGINEELISTWKALRTDALLHAAQQKPNPNHVFSLVLENLDKAAGIERPIPAPAIK